jgi:protein SCO1/2
MRPQVRRLIIALWALVVAVAVFFAVRLYMVGDGSTPTAATEGSAIPAIGGPFTLVDQTGKTVTEADFRGKWMLIYFGYTYCPDVCPTSLTTMVDALDQLGDKGKNVVPVFITVDPERDTPKQLADYVAAFSPRLVGLTGTPEQIAAAARAYRVYYAKAKEGGSTAYLMDHSSIVYLVDPDGKFRQHFSSNQIDADEMAKRLRGIL